MGGCCSCLSSKPGSDKLGDSSGRYNYGTIRTSSEVIETPRETEILVKATSARPSNPISRTAIIPESNLKVTPDRSFNKQNEKSTKEGSDPPPQKLSNNISTEQSTDLILPRTESAGDTSKSESERQSTEVDETFSDSDTTRLVTDPTDTGLKKKKKKKKKNLGLAGITKTAGKMKKVIHKHGKGQEKSQIYQQKKPAKNSPNTFERQNLERVSSTRMKSKYARERMEKYEKEREERDKHKQMTTGFRDPREAAMERGEKLNELSDTTDRMRNQAAGFASTSSQLARTMKK